MTRMWIASALVFAALTTGSASEQWPQFRGMQAGVAPDDPALPDTWSRTENIAWTLDVPGMGWSSPVVWDNLIFLTSVVRPDPVELPKLGFYVRHAGGPGVQGAREERARRDRARFTGRCARQPDRANRVKAVPNHEPRVEVRA